MWRCSFFGGNKVPDDNFPRSKFSKPEADLTTGGSMQQRWVIVRHATVWHPPTDVYELNDRLVVIVEIAGMKDGDFNVSLQGQQLIVTGQRRRVAPVDCAYYQLEVWYGDFRTEVSLPWPVVRDSVSAVYRDGFLQIELPRAQARQVQVVKVEMEDAPDDVKE
jgi:HSP20 family protein